MFGHFPEISEDVADDAERPDPEQHDHAERHHVLEVVAGQAAEGLEKNPHRSGPASQRRCYHLLKFHMRI